MKDKDTTVVTLKGFPVDLHKGLKIRAAVEGTTMKGLILKAAAEYISAEIIEDKEAGKMEKVKARIVSKEAGKRKGK